MPFVIRLAAETENDSLADRATAVDLLNRITTGKKPGKYLEWSDPDGNGGDGREKWTDDVTKAKQFDTPADAHACWTAQSKKRPIRPDGEPNRPMTAFSIVIEPADAAQQQ